MLSINSNGGEPLDYFLLPLIDNHNNKNNPLLPLSIIELIGDPCIPLVFSDLVKEGHIKSITISSNEYSDQQAVYEMVVKNGLVQQASYRFTSKEENVRRFCLEEFHDVVKGFALGAVGLIGTVAQ